MKRFAAIGLMGVLALGAGGCGGGGDGGAPVESNGAASMPAAAANAPAAPGTGPAPAPAPGTDPAADVGSKTGPALTAAEPRPLIDAAKRGDVEAIRRALATGEPVDQGDYKFENTPLMHAAIKGCVPCVELLLDHGADINHMNSGYATPLIWAAMQGSAAMVQVLLQRGADPHYSTPSGRTALTVARERAEDMEKALIIVLLEQAAGSGG